MSPEEEKRLGFVGIIVESREQSASELNRILSDHADAIVARVGLPRRDRRGCSVITLVVDATTDELGRLTGRLGQLPGVSVKSALGRKPQESAGAQDHSTVPSAPDR